MEQRNRFLGNLTTAEVEAAKKEAEKAAKKSAKKTTKKKAAKKNEAQDAPLFSDASEPREGEVQTKAKKTKPASKSKTEPKTKSGQKSKEKATDEKTKSKKKQTKAKSKKSKAKAKKKAETEAAGKTKETEGKAEAKKDKDKKAETQKDKAKKDKAKKDKGKKGKGKKDKKPVTEKEEPAAVSEKEEPVVAPAEEELLFPDEEGVIHYWSPRQRPTSSGHVKRHRTRSRRLTVPAGERIAAAEKRRPAEAAVSGATAQETAAQEQAAAAPASKTKGWVTRNIPAAVLFFVIVAGVLFGIIPMLREEVPPFAVKADHARKEMITGIDWTERVLDRLPQAKSGAVAMGNYTPSKATKDALKEEIAEVRKSGHHVGFVMLDLETGQGLAYDTGREFYGASSIKIHRIMGIVAKHPDVLTKYRGSIRAVLTYSDNDAYATLYRAYGNGVLNAWVKKAGARVRYNPSMQYVYYDTRSLTRLWFLDYKSMKSGKDFDQVGKWAENPELSPIHQVLGKSHTTRTKAGWIAEGGYYAAVDGGIVYGKDSDYLLVVMSDYGADLNRLKPIIRTLDKAHTEALKQLESEEEEEPEEEPEKKLKFPF